MAHSLPGWDYSIDSYTNKNKRLASAQLFKDIHRILKPTGKLYLTTVNGAHVYYQGKQKPKLEDIIAYAEGLFNIDNIIGWNPLPVLANIISRDWLGRMPAYVRKLLFLPSTKMYSCIPGIWKILFALSKNKILEQYCRHLLVVCHKL